MAELNTPVHPVTMYAAKRAYAWKAPDPMAIFCIGQSDIYPYYNLFVGIEDQSLLMAEEIQNPMNLMIGRLDLAFVVIYILPIIIIALAFNLLSGEREAETSRLVQTQHVSLGKYLFYKLAFRFTLIYGAFLLTALLTTSLLAPSFFSVLRLSLWIYMLLVALYITFWLFLAFFINSFQKSSEVNGLLLIACWVLWLFLIPSVIGLVAEKKYQIPSRNMQVLEERDYTIEIERKEAVEAYLLRHPELRTTKTTPVGAQPLEWYPGFIAAQDSLFRLDRDYSHKLQEKLLLQQKFIARAAYFSPALMLRLAMNGLAKNSLFHFIHYQRLIDEFIQTWRIYLGKFVFLKQKMQASDFENLPDFNYSDVKNEHRSWVVYSLIFLGINLLLLVTGFKRTLQ